MEPTAAAATATADDAHRRSRAAGAAGSAMDVRNSRTAVSSVVAVRNGPQSLAFSSRNRPSSSNVAVKDSPVALVAVSVPDARSTEKP